MNNTKTDFRSTRLQKLSKTAWITTIIFKWLAWAAALAFVIIGSVIIAKGEKASGTALITSAGDALLGSFIILLLEYILKELKEGNTPFTYKNADRVRNIARLQLGLFIWTIVRELIWPETLDLSEFAATAENGGLVIARTEISFTPLLVCFIIYVLAFVFEYGVRLQQQADETL